MLGDFTIEDIRKQKKKIISSYFAINKIPFTETKHLVNCNCIGDFFLSPFHQIHSQNWSTWLVKLDILPSRSGKRYVYESNNQTTIGLRSWNFTLYFSKISTSKQVNHKQIIRVLSWTLWSKAHKRLNNINI